MNKFIIGVFLLILPHVVQGQVSPEIEYLLSKRMLEQSRIGNPSFINKMQLTDGHFIVLADKTRFYFFGYGGAYSKEIRNSEIESFCLKGKILFYLNHNTIYGLDLLNNKESVLFELPFKAKGVWSGENLLYTEKIEHDNNILVAIDPSKKICVELFRSDSEIKDVIEYGNIIYVLTDARLTMVSLQDKKYVEIPLSENKPEKLHSLTIDKENNAMYVSSESGVFRIYDNSFQKVCNDTGLLCYETNGLLVYNNNIPYIIKINQNILYPQKTEVIIELK